MDLLDESPDHFKNIILLQIDPTQYKKLVDINDYAKERFSDENFFDQYYHLHVRVEDNGIYKMPFLGNARYGEEKGYFPHERTRYIRQWKDDQFHGYLKGWYCKADPSLGVSEDDQIRFILRGKNGKNDGDDEEWHENGERKSMKRWKNGKQDGDEEWWNIEVDKWQCLAILAGNTKLSNMGTGIKKWQDGKKEGKEEMWYPDGSKLLIIEWKDGKQDGDEEWYENGERRVIRRWKDGKQE